MCPCHAFAFGHPALIQGRLDLLYPRSHLLITVHTGYWSILWCLLQGQRVCAAEYDMWDLALTSMQGAGPFGPLRSRVRRTEPR